MFPMVAPGVKSRTTCDPLGWVRLSSLASIASRIVRLWFTIPAVIGPLMLS